MTGAGDVGPSEAVGGRSATAEVAEATVEIREDGNDELAVAGPESVAEVGPDPSDGGTGVGEEVGQVRDGAGEAVTGVAEVTGDAVADDVGGGLMSAESDESPGGVSGGGEAGPSRRRVEAGYYHAGDTGDRSPVPGTSGTDATEAVDSSGRSGGVERAPTDDVGVGVADDGGVASHVSKEAGGDYSVGGAGSGDAEGDDAGSGEESSQGDGSDIGGVHSAVWDEGTAVEDAVAEVVEVSGDEVLDEVQVDDVDGSVGESGVYEAPSPLSVGVSGGASRDDAVYAGEDEGDDSSGDGTGTGVGGAYDTDVVSVRASGADGAAVGVRVDDDSETGERADRRGTNDPRVDDDGAGAGTGRDEARDGRSRTSHDSAAVASGEDS